MVAVSTYMASEHGNRSDQKDWFMAGYNELLQRIEPVKIICYNTPFPEMQGDIVYVDYERSSWKFMNYERFVGNDDLESFKIGGQPALYHDTIGMFMDVPSKKGGGSAYGGEWKPSKPADKKFIGKPGEMKPSFTKKGDLYETHIGPNGRADYEIHHSDHGFPKYHEIPHRHEIYWDERGPHLGHDDLPLKQFRARSVFVKMSSPVGVNTYEDDRFKSISDFKWCMKRGGEVQFEWKGISYCCFGCVCPAPGRAPRMVIAQAGSVEVNARTEKWCDTADELLEYMVGGDRLRDVITQVTVWERTI